MNTRQIEEVKARTKIAMSVLAKLPREQLLKNCHEEVMSELLKENILSIRLESVVRLQKLVLAGHKPQPLSEGQIEEFCSKLPRRLDAVYKASNGKTLVVQMKGAPMTQAKKALLVDQDKIPLITDKRYRDRKRNNTLTLNGTPIDKKMSDLSDELLRLMHKSGFVRCLLVIPSNGESSKSWRQHVDTTQYSTVFETIPEPLPEQE